MEWETFTVDSYLRGDEAFQFARVDLATRFPAKAHDHDFYEVFLVEAGRTAHWINGAVQVLEPGQLVFVRPSDRHAFRADRKSGCRIVNVLYRPATAAHLASRYADTVAGRFFDSPGELPETHTLGPLRFERAIDAMYRLRATERGLARIEELLLTLVNSVADIPATIDTEAPRWFVSACSAAHAPEVFRGGAAAFIAVCGRSHEHVCRVTRDQLGLTPTQFVNRIRVEHAADLLRGEGVSIEDVALQAGFESTGYFYRLFRNRYGTTPHRFRQRHRRSPV